MSAPTELAEWERELIESGPPVDAGQCDRCSRFRTLRLWPLTDRPRMLCGPCWLERVRGEVVERWGRHGVRVSTTHPQHGALYRGTIRPVGIRHGGLQPAVVWLVQNQDSTAVAHEMAGDYVDARAVLFDATGWADRLDPTNETEE